MTGEAYCFTRVHDALGVHTLLFLAGEVTLLALASRSIPDPIDQRERRSARSAIAASRSASSARSS
jgi:hypothetical protein